MSTVTRTEALPFLSVEWAQAAREAVDQAPAEKTRATKQDAYWKWLERARESFSTSWALGVRADQPAGGTAHLRLGWRDGRCVEASVTVPGEPVSADFVVSGTYETWQGLLTGEQDPTRALLYRQLRLETGESVLFFRGLFVFVESLAALAQLPTRFEGGQQGITDARGQDA